MAELADYDFSTTDAGASTTVPLEAGQIKVGSHMVMKNEFPCKITAVSHSKTGKHGSAKCNITGLDIYTNKKYEGIFPASEVIQVPVIKRIEYALVDIDDDFCHLMDDDGNIREDLSLPIQEDAALAADIKKKFEDEGKDWAVVVLSSMNKEQIKSVKEVTKAS